MFSSIPTSFWIINQWFIIIFALLAETREDHSHSVFRCYPSRINPFRFLQTHDPPCHTSLSHFACLVAYCKTNNSLCIDVTCNVMERETFIASYQQLASKYFQYMSVIPVSTKLPLSFSVLMISQVVSAFLTSAPRLDTTWERCIPTLSHLWRTEKASYAFCNSDSWWCTNWSPCQFPVFKYSTAHSNECFSGDAAALPRKPVRNQGLNACVVYLFMIFPGMPFSLTRSLFYQMTW